MSHSNHHLSSVTVNRLSLYLRCLHCLSEKGVRRISSKQLAEMFHLSAAQIRKDLAQIGGLGIRGVGYDVTDLAERLQVSLGLDRVHRLVIVGMGNLGRALGTFLAFDDGRFKIVGAFDTDPEKIATPLENLQIQHIRDLAEVVRTSGAEIGVLAVPAAVAQENYDALVAAGIKAILNFAPVRLDPDPRIRTKDVDLRTHLEELGFFLMQDMPAAAGPDEAVGRRPCEPCSHYS